ncbi:MAG: patatin-like phospholipase family protein [Parachlamydiaceae bacterium]
MSPEVHPFQGNILSWNKERLAEECATINNNRDGKRETRYRAILCRFQENLKTITTRKELIGLRDRFKIIQANVAGDIGECPDFAAYLGSTEKEIETCYELVERIKGIQKKLPRWPRQRDLAHLNISIRKIEHQVSSKLLPIHKNRIDKCNEHYLFCLHYDYTQQSSKKVFSDYIAPSRQSQEEEKAPSYATRPDSKSIYPILSLDGGGLRGIIPASVLVEIERITREPTAKLFKLIGGTSTGGILALGLSKPNDEDPEHPQYTAEDLLNMYTQEHAKIFRLNPNYSLPSSHLKWDEKIRWRFNHPKYEDPSRFFKEKLGSKTLSSALTDVVVVANTSDELISKITSIVGSGLSKAVSVTSTMFGGPQYSTLEHDDTPKTVHLYTRKGLKTFSYRLQDLKARHLTHLSHQIASVNRADFYMHHVATVTSAAPTYFPPVEVDYKVSGNPQTTNNFLIDGGVLQNNPTLSCVFEALNHGHKKEDLFLLSLGTGGNDSIGPSDFKDLGDLWSDVTQPYFETHNIMSYMIGDRYHRLQYEFDPPAPPLDDTRPETIQFLENCGRQLVEENADGIRDICKVLKPDSI